MKSNTENENIAVSSYCCQKAALKKSAVSIKRCTKVLIKLKLKLCVHIIKLKSEITVNICRCKRII